jgi:hypothetical protein
MLWPGCYRIPAQKGTFLSSYKGNILMEFRHDLIFLWTNAKASYSVVRVMKIALRFFSGRTG